MVGFDRSVLIGQFFEDVFREVGFGRSILGGRFCGIWVLGGGF